jgi:hypothetical protein
MLPITSAQGPGAASVVFFVNGQGNLAFWQSNEEPEQPKGDARRYTDDFIKINGSKVQCSSKDLAALAYQWKGAVSVSCRIGEFSVILHCD